MRAPAELLIVGESNPHGPEPRFALFDRPANCAGDRLRRLILGVRRSTYFGLGRVNLCSGRWSDPLARNAARTMLDEHGEMPILLLGKKVAGAFGLAALFPFGRAPDRPLVVIPHPSGRNLLWNDAGTIERARSLIAAIAPSLPLGELGDDAGMG